MSVVGKTTAHQSWHCPLRFAPAPVYAMARISGDFFLLIKLLVLKVLAFNSPGYKCTNTNLNVHGQAKSVHFLIHLSKKQFLCKDGGVLLRIMNLKKGKLNLQVSKSTEEYSICAMD